MHAIVKILLVNYILEGNSSKFSIAKIYAIRQTIDLFLINHHVVFFHFTYWLKSNNLLMLLLSLQVVTIKFYLYQAKHVSR